MPGITEDLMVNSGNVDFEKMKQTPSILHKSFMNAEQLHITTEEGIDIILVIRSRVFTHDFSIKESEICNLPCGGIYCEPLESEAEGVVVFNPSIGDIAILKDSLRVYVNKRKIAE